MNVLKILSVAAVLTLTAIINPGVAIDTNKTLESELEQANQLFEMSNYEEALNAYQKIIQQENVPTEALWKASVCLTTLPLDAEQSDPSYSNIKEAIDLAVRAIKSDPDDANAHFAKVKAMYALTEIMGNRMFVRGYENLVKQTEKGLQKDADHAGLNYLRGKIDLKQAMLLSRVADKSGKDVNKDKVGNLLESAENKLKIAVELNPERISYRYQLAKVYERMNQTTLAAQNYDEIIELSPRNQQEFMQRNAVQQEVKDRKMLSKAD